MYGNIGFEDTLLLRAVVILLMGWWLLWKGLALWKAARRNHLPWFIVLMIVPTVGILEIIYALAIAKGRDDGSAMATPTPAAR